MNSKRASAYVTLAAAAFVLLLLYGGVIHSLEDKLTRPLEFRFRTLLQKSPQIDPRLKIYSYDDSTLRFVGKPDLDFALWLRILQQISAVHPQRIMIDKIFGVVEHNFSQEDLKLGMESLTTPVITAVYTSPAVINYNVPLSATHKDFDLGAWAGHPVTGTDLPWLPLQAGYVYGPDPKVMQVFASFGHILYAQNGAVDLFRRYEPSHAVPHWSLLAADRLRMDDQGVYINDQKVPEVKGRISLNMLDPDLLRKNIWGMSSLIDRVQKGRSLKGVIKPDQYVVILPGMFTGSSDRVETPVGNVPGAHVILSLLNSVLTGQWIRTWPSTGMEIALFAVLGWLLTWRFHPIVSPLSVLTAIVLTIAGGFMAFAWFSWQLPWVGASLSLTLSGLCHLIYIAMARVREAQRVTTAISGLVPPEQIRSLLKERRALEFEPAGHEVSIMFVDIVGFSLTTKKLSASESFLQLKSLLGDITEIVHRHQGTIDKTLGDGLLCFFGYNVLGQESPHHADQAVRCATEIQRQLFQFSLRAFAEGKALYPLRIGINTASVFIGNIGSNQRFDFTMVGDGVNFAARLETACAPFKIMIGPATKAQLTDPAPDHPSLKKRLIMVKHTSDLLEAWEVDPFKESGENVDRVEELYWNSAGIYQREERFAVALSAGLRVNSPLGRFEINNYSLSGLGLQSDVYLAQGVVLSLTLEAEDKGTQRELQQWGLTSLIVEVCWGGPRLDVFEHGVRFVGLNLQQKTRIFDLLRNLLPSIQTRGA